MSATVVLWRPLFLHVPQGDDGDPGDIPLARLIKSLQRAGMEVSAKDEAVYNTG